MEQPFFFENKGHSIFGILHSPSEKCVNAGFVFCYPFAYEGDCCRRIYSAFARRLADIGYHILRFNYMGTGDSSGSLEDATVETHVSDIIRAINVLQEKSKVQRIGLLGMRLGATWAGLAAVESNIRVDPLILWDPIVNVKKFLDNGFRQSLSFQSVLFQEIVFDRKQIIEKLLSDGKVEHHGCLLNVIDGCTITRDFYIQAINIDLPAQLRDYSGNILIVQIDSNTATLRPELVDLANLCRAQALKKLEGSAPRVDLLQVNEPTNWWLPEGKYRSSKPHQISNVTVNWISQALEKLKTSTLRKEHGNTSKVPK